MPASGRGLLYNEGYVDPCHFISLHSIHCWDKYLWWACRWNAEVHCTSSSHWWHRSWLWLGNKWFDLDTEGPQPSTYSGRDSKNVRWWNGSGWRRWKIVFQLNIHENVRKAIIVGRQANSQIGFFLGLHLLPPPKFVGHLKEVNIDLKRKAGMQMHWNSELCLRFVVECSTCPLD